MSPKFLVRTCGKTALVLSTFVAICTVALGQTNPRNLPQPPKVELQKFEPFLGKYEVSGDYANLPWAGTLELKTVIKGWYIEQIIQITSPGIDREFWVLVTWDKNAQKYRLWGFQTLPSQVEGEVHFEGDEMITQFTYPVADGQQALSTNRYRLTGKNELLITSYRQLKNGPVEKIGTLRGKRTNGPDAASLSSREKESKLSTAEPQPGPQLQSLADAFEGRWRITEQYEPDDWTPHGGTGYGEEVWRRGPGGYTLMEEVHDGPTGDSYGLALIWWDKTKNAFHGIWCINTNPDGCTLGRDVNGSFKWDGKQQVVDNEFQRNGKTFQWHEVFTDITPTSFVQTADIGEKGGPLKRWLSIHATRIEDGRNAVQTSAATSFSGKMGIYNALLGEPWTCTHQAGNQPPTTEAGTVTFVVAPQNVLEIVVSGPNFAARNFIGFDAKSSQYWRTEMGVFGGILRETSSDGVNFSGLNLGGPQAKGSAPFPIRSVMTVAPDGRSSDLTEEFPDNNVTLIHRCTR